MRVSIEYNLPDDLELYKNALQDMKYRKIMKTPLTAKDKIEVTLTVEELDRIDTLLNSAIDTCNEYMQHWSGKHKDEIKAKLTKTRSEYAELSNYLNFMKQVRTLKNTP